MNSLLQNDYFSVLMALLSVVGHVISSLMHEHTTLKECHENALEKCRKWQQKRSQGVWRFVLWRTLPFVVLPWLLAGILLFTTMYPYRHNIPTNIWYDSFAIDSLDIALIYLVMFLLFLTKAIGLWVIRERYCKDCLEPPITNENEG